MSATALQSDSVETRFERHGFVDLADGRRLSFAEYGNPAGVPVFYFHGFPGSRLEAGYFQYPTLRLIAVDRPGYGGSDPLLQRTLMDWPGDVEALADHLGLKRFFVAGLSGGAPYAATTAYVLQDRVEGLALVSGLGPPCAPGMNSRRIKLLRALGRRPMTQRVLFALVRQVVLAPHSVKGLSRMRRSMRKVAKDAEALDPEFARFLVMSWREGVRRSAAGMGSDARIYANDWPFDPAGIKSPVHIWHGVADEIVPVSIGRYYSHVIPHARTRFIDDEGHVSLVRNHLYPILENLVDPGIPA